MRLVNVFAWIMILGGLVFGFSFLALAVFTPHPKPESATTVADFRAIFLVVAYMPATTAVLGAGLRTRLDWSWYGSVAISFTFAFVGLLIPIMVASANSAKPAGILGGVILAAALLLPAMLLLWQLFRPAVRENFGTLAVPPVWIRIIAVSYLTGSGLTFLGALDPSRRALFGLVKNAGLLSAYAIIAGLLWIWVGRGLYEYRETARRWAICLSVFSIADYSCFTVMDPATPSKFYVRVFTLFLVTVISLLTVWYLHTRRRWFAVSTGLETDPQT